MPLYELTYLARQDVSQSQVDSMTNQFKEVIEQGEGKVGKTEYWGLKSLTYKIKKNRKAHFSLINIDAPSAAVAELERQMRLSSDVLRFLTIRVDEHETAPSVMMRTTTLSRLKRVGGLFPCSMRSRVCSSRSKSLAKVGSTSTSRRPSVTSGTSYWLIW